MPPAETTTPAILSVSELNQLTARTLHAHIDQVWVSGEISNFIRAQSGHAYFTLKDGNAQIRCAFFKLKQSRQHLSLQNGQEVVIHGQVGLYQPRGDYQLIVNTLEEYGAGALQRAFEKLKKELTPLFDPVHKQPLPKIPRSLGVITSPTGAAIRDILSVTQRRFPSLPIVIYPTLVQGAQAAPKIVKAIQTANQRAEVDLLILGRGGGSIEDLWAFNEADVAHAIFDSHIPIITGIGHESDTTIADWVSDLRAATPSAAAEHATPLAQNLSEKNGLHQRRLTQCITQLIQNLRHHTLQLHSKLIHPDTMLYQQSQKLDDLQRRLIQNIAMQCEQRRQQLRHFASLLNNMNPLNTLSRGYSMVYDAQQQLLHEAEQIKIGDPIQVRWAKGIIHADVTKTEE